MGKTTKPKERVNKLMERGKNFGEKLTFDAN